VYAFSSFHPHNGLLINSGVANIYADPAFHSPVITQGILGESLEILDSRDDWFRVRQWDNYEGWIYRFFVVETPDHWEPDFTFEGMRGVVYSSPNEDTPSIRQCVTGVKLPGVSLQDHWYQVRLPDQEVGYIRAPRSLTMPQELSDRILYTGERFLGTSYVWGGKTALGCDCSGLVQTVFWLNGITLPRDSHQQAERGIGISREDTGPGDLFFFGDQDAITHVGIAYDNNRFLHCAGYVRINSLDSEAEDYLPQYANAFQMAKRIIN